MASHELGHRQAKLKKRTPGSSSPFSLADRTRPSTSATMTHSSLLGGQTSRQAAVGAWFLGPRAEKFRFLSGFFRYILRDQMMARKNLHLTDPDFVTAEMQQSEVFKENMELLRVELQAISKVLSNHPVPFWSSRFNAHMNMDTTLPGIIGYLATMLYNPNNVAAEASPLTTLVENRVRQQLSHMLGYNTECDRPTDIVAWGHITSGGTVANLESIWAARNLKFHPLSLRLAIDEGPLQFVKELKPPFQVKLCDGTDRVFAKCSVWELLNLRPSTVLDLPHQLYNSYGISQQFLQTVIAPYLIQTLGKDYIEKHFGINKPAQILVGATKHYSWPKNAATAGIGSQNVVDVSVDNAARMDINALEKMLEERIAGPENQRTPIYAVVAIMGSTEQGAVDPLSDIVALRTKFESRDFRSPFTVIPPGADTLLP